MTRTLLFQMHVPKLFWADAILTTCYLINRMPSSILNGSIPYSVLFPSRVLLTVSPRIFGCVCFVRDHRPGNSKLDPKALKCLFVGYSRTQKGYRCFSPDLNKYLVSSDVSFFENSPFVSVPHDTSELDTDLPTHVITTRTTTPVPPPRSTPEIRHVYSRRSRTNDASRNIVPPSTSSADPHPTSELDLPIALRKGTRSCTQHPISASISYTGISPTYSVSLSTMDAYSLPKTVKEAQANPGWRKAMFEELEALEKNGTWELVHPLLMLLLLGVNGFLQ